MFIEINSRLHHDGKASVANILNSLGVDKVVKELEVQTGGSASRSNAPEDTSIFSRRERMRDTAKHGCVVSQRSVAGR